MNSTKHNRLIVATETPTEISKKELISVFNFVNTKYSKNIDFDVSLAFVDKKLAKEINKRHTGNNYASDVLSFNYPKNLSGKVKGQNVGGEIVICTEIAQENAKKNKFDLRSELALLLVHGMLHLDGLDHVTAKQQTRFETMQSDILKTLDYNYRKMQWLA